MPLSIFQGNDKAFKFIRRDLNGNIISTVPQGIWFSKLQTAFLVHTKRRGRDDGSMALD